MAGPAGAADAGAPLDQRDLLGDLPEAVRFAELLRAAPGVVSAELGVRLQSRAASQSLECYLSKDAAAGIGSAVAAAGGPGAAAPPPQAAAAGAAGAASYNLVLRKEQSVQEVALVASLTRTEVRELAAATVAALTADPQAAVPA